MAEYETLAIYLTVFGVGAIALGGFLSFLWVAPGVLSDKALRARRWLTGGFLAWFAVAFVTGYTVDLFFALFAPFAIIPIAGVLFLSFRDDVAEVLASIPTHWMIYLQFYRTAGAIFLFMYYASGSLSEGFATNAGWGDVLTGVLALPVGYMVMRGTPYHMPALILWSIIGIGDLFLAPASAVVYGAEQLVEFPINLIPLWLGPPFGISMHILVLRIYYLRRAGGQPVPA